MTILDYDVIFYIFFYWFQCIELLVFSSYYTMKKPVLASNLMLKGRLLFKICERSNMDARFLLVQTYLRDYRAVWLCLSLFCQTFSLCYRSWRSRLLKRIGHSGVWAFSLRIKNTNFVFGILVFLLVFFFVSRPLLWKRPDNEWNKLHARNIVFYFYLYFMLRSALGHWT
jgi:hypothetical protein